MTNDENNENWEECRYIPPKHHPFHAFACYTKSDSFIGFPSVFHLVMSSPQRCSQISDAKNPLSIKSSGGGEVLLPFDEGRVRLPLPSGRVDVLLTFGGVEMPLAFDAVEASLSFDEVEAPDEVDERSSSLSLLFGILKAI